MLTNNEDMVVLCYLSGYVAKKWYRDKNIKNVDSF